MNSGMYAALSGNLTAMRRLDALANNLANVTTAGYKKDRVLFESLLANANPPVSPAGSLLSGDRGYTDFTAGPIRQTGNSLDVALNGEGFFVVNTPQGTAYTRQGRFQRDANGRLVTSEGYEVQGGGGITIPGGKVDIDQRGRITVEGREVATLDIVDFPKPYALQKIGSTLFVPADSQAIPQSSRSTLVQQGHLEDSNVNAIQEMAQLIETSRTFEACQKVVRSFDELNEKAANELGKL